MEIVVRDIRTEGWKEERKREATQHLGKMYKEIAERNLVTQPGTILEIGSGAGGVTAALQDLFPTSPIITVDSDTDPKVRNAAEQAGAVFLERDASKMTDEEIGELTRLKGITQIVGLRIPGKAAKRLVEGTRHNNYRGIVIVSLAEHEEEETIENYFNPLRWKKEAIRVFLQNDQYLTEIGFVIPPQPTNP